MSLAAEVIAASVEIALVCGSAMVLLLRTPVWPEGLDLSTFCAGSISESMSFLDCALARFLLSSGMIAL